MSDDSTWWRAASSILFLAALMILCQGGVARAGAEHPVRTWTDSTGRFTIEASLVSAEGEQVLLERADGTMVRIDLEKLSAVDLNPQQEEWSFEPVSPASPAFEITRRITAPPKRDFFEKTAGLAVSPNGRRAVIGYVLGRPRTEETTRLVYCDLESGRALNVPEVPGQMMPLAVPPEGNLVLMRRHEFGHGNQDRLELWSLSAEGVRSQVQWTSTTKARSRWSPRQNGGIVARSPIAPSAGGLASARMRFANSSRVWPLSTKARPRGNRGEPTCRALSAWRKVKRCSSTCGGVNGPIIRFSSGSNCRDC